MGYDRQRVLTIFVFVLQLAVVLTIVIIVVVKSQERTTEHTTAAAVPKTTTTPTTTVIPPTTKTTAVTTNTTTAIPTTTTTAELTTATPTAEPTTTPTTTLTSKSPDPTTTTAPTTTVPTTTTTTTTTATTVTAGLCSPKDPTLSLPLQMVVNSPTASEYDSGSNTHMICTGELGDPNGNTLAVETNVNGNWESLDVGGTEDSSVNNSECSRIQELTKHSLVFGSQYNNTEVRCVVKDDMGQYTTPLRTSPSLPVLLIPESLCIGVTDERFPHPYVCTAHLWCANGILYTYSCGATCPVFTNGTFAYCSACPPECVP